MVEHVEEMSLEDEQEVMSETSEDAWKLESEGETVWKASTRTPMVEVTMSGGTRKVPEGKAKRQVKKVKKLSVRLGKCDSRNRQPESAWSK